MDNNEIAILKELIKLNKIFLQEIEILVNDYQLVKQDEFNEGHIQDMKTIRLKLIDIKNFLNN